MLPWARRRGAPLPASALSARAHQGITILVLRRVTMAASGVADWPSGRPSTRTDVAAGGARRTIIVYAIGFVPWACLGTSAEQRHEHVAPVPRARDRYGALQHCGMGAMGEGFKIDVVLDCITVRYPPIRGGTVAGYGSSPNHHAAPGANDVCRQPPPHRRRRASYAGGPRVIVWHRPSPCRRRHLARHSPYDPAPSRDGKPTGSRRPRPHRAGPAMPADRVPNGRISSHVSASGTGRAALNPERLPATARSRDVKPRHHSISARKPGVSNAQDLDCFRGYVDGSCLRGMRAGGGRYTEPPDQAQRNY